MYRNDKDYIDVDCEELNDGGSDSVLNEVVLKKLEEPEVDRPSIPVHGKVEGILNYSAMLAGRLCERTGRVFRYPGGGAVEVDEGKTAGLRELTQPRLIILLELLARPVSVEEVKGQLIATPKICPAGFAKLILQHDAFLNELREIKVTSKGPLLVQDEDSLKVVCGGQCVNGFYAAGDPPDIPEHIDEAVERILEPFRDFVFFTECDKSRAIAGMLLPLLVLGGLMDGRAPALLAEADKSQAGKGFMFKIIRAVYGQAATIVNSSQGSVGSLAEAIDTALVSKKPMVQIDNMRGNVDSQKVESVLTETNYSARRAYSQAIEVDPSHTVFMITTNSMSMTEDLSNRILPIRIRKRDMGKSFHKYPEGNILQHVTANQPRYLGAVMKLVMVWDERSRPFNEEARTKHNMREFAGIAEWLVHDLMGLPSVFGGIEEIRVRLFSPELSWLRDVGMTVFATERVGQALAAKEVLELLEEEGRYDLQPGVKEHESIDNESCMKRTLQAFGRKVGRLFRKADQVLVEGIRVVKTMEKRSRPDGNGRRETACYRFESEKAA